MFSLFPLVWLLLTSLKPDSALVSSKPVFVFSPTMDHYQQVLSPAGQSAGHFFWNSLMVTASSTILSVGIGLFAAYALARLRPPGHRQVAVVILAMRMLPPVALVLPFYLGAEWIGIFDTRIALIIAYTGLNIPLATWILQGFMLDLPRDIEHAAWVDGASYMQTFFRIVLPLTGPGIAAASVFAFVLPWNDLAIALPLAPFDATTLPPFAARVRTDSGVAWGHLGAISTLIVIPVVVFTVVASKWLVKGLTTGAVK
jgi:multiple sugar transport system permease protein